VSGEAGRVGRVPHQAERTVYARQDAHDTERKKMSKRRRGEEGEESNVRFDRGREGLSEVLLLLLDRLDGVLVALQLLVQLRSSHGQVDEGNDDEAECHG
jgi:hypothetical protein